MSNKMSFTKQFKYIKTLSIMKLKTAYNFTSKVPLYVVSNLDKKYH